MTFEDLFNNCDLIKKMLLELEPDIEKIGSPIDITNDPTYGIKYSNIDSILKCLIIYLKKHEENYKFTKLNDIKAIVDINSLIKNDEAQIIQFVI